MKITGTITQVFPVQGGTSQTGNAWQKQEFIVEYVHGEYPKAILFSTMDANIIGKLAVGQEVEVTFDFTVRSWTNPQGVTKYFNEPRIWRDGIHCVQRQEQQQVAQPQQQAPVQQPAAQPQQQPAAPANDDSQLPF